MRKFRGTLGILAAVCLSTLLLVLLGVGWGVSIVPKSLHAQESLPADSGAAELSTNPGHNVELVGHIGGGARAVAVQGTYAYAGIGISLVVVDVSQPTTPTIIASLPLPIATANGYRSVVTAIAIEDGYAYVTEGDGGLRVVDIMDPTRPVVVGLYDASGYASDVTVNGDFAYLVDGGFAHAPIGYMSYVNRS